MRVKINFTKNSKPVPIQNYSLLNSYVHTCLGKNNKYHDSKDKKGFYNISNMQGGQRIEGTTLLDFKDGAYFCVSAFQDDIKIIDLLIAGINENPEFGFGMKFTEIEFVYEKFIDGVNEFLTLSPILLKEPRPIGSKDPVKFWLYTDKEFAEKLKERTIKKLLIIDPDLNLKDFDIQIPSRESNKVKSILVKNVINKASQCPINIRCNKKVAEILYTVGIGQSTNSGFGCVCKAENHKKYRNKKMVNQMQNA